MAARASTAAFRWKVKCVTCDAFDVPKNEYPGDMTPAVTEFMCTTCSPTKRAAWIVREIPAAPLHKSDTKSEASEDEPQLDVTEEDPQCDAYLWGRTVTHHKRQWTLGLDEHWKFAFEGSQGRVERDMVADNKAHVWLEEVRVGLEELRTCCKEGRDVRQPTRSFGMYLNPIQPEEPHIFL